MYVEWANKLRFLFEFKLMLLAIRLLDKTGMHFAQGKANFKPSTVGNDREQEGTNSPWDNEWENVSSPRSLTGQDLKVIPDERELCKIRETKSKPTYEIRKVKSQVYWKDFQRLPSSWGKPQSMWFDREMLASIIVFRREPLQPNYYTLLLYFLELGIGEKF